MKAKFHLGQHVVTDKGTAGYIKGIITVYEEWLYKIGIADVLLTPWVAESDIKEYAGDQTTRAI